MKKLAEMNLLDDFLFWTVISDKEFGPQLARYLLRVILNRPVGEVKVHAQYSLPGNDTDFHGIRMDAYVSEEKDSEDGAGQVTGELYDIEPDKIRSKKSALPLRVRFYHALIDAKSLESGKNYDSLMPTYVIMITDYDPFDRNRVLYTVRNRCLEEPDMPYEDRMYTLFLYTDGEQCDLPADLIHLLKFIKSTTKENSVNTDLETIYHMVEDMKQREEVQKAYMKFQEMLQEERRAGEEAERQRTEKLVAEANNRAEREKERADQAEQTILLLKQELENMRSRVWEK